MEMKPALDGVFASGASPNEGEGPGPAFGFISGPGADNQDRDIREGEN
jgi:hypothetical protein